MHPTFRWTFLFGKNNNSDEKLDDIRTFLVDYTRNKKKLEDAGIFELLHIHSYERVIIAHDFDSSADQLLIPALVVVFYGDEWSEFIGELFAFNLAFPEEEFPRLFSEAYQLIDEQNDISDLPLFKGRKNTDSGE